METYIGSTDSLRFHLMQGALNKTKTNAIASIHRLNRFPEVPQHARCIAKTKINVIASIHRLNRFPEVPPHSKCIEKTK
eukprot:1682039-Amphidinium_carterae.1